ncbi:MAG: DNA-directed RNA polymerase subunit beta [Planctomycetes bacterium]|nr:DNA-directed RNA polymerase subunit beta [Planctomycetota bacterium]
MQKITERRVFGTVKDLRPVKDLCMLQVDSYEKFLQRGKDPAKRKKDVGLEAIIREIFPIKSSETAKKEDVLELHYLSYELGRPRYEPDECRKLRHTFSAPFKIKCRLEKPDGPVEEDVYLGEIPLMIGGGEFIVNGAERVIVSQLHRSPGVDFGVEVQSTEKKLHNCRIIPERGSWIELNVTKKDVLQVRIDQSGKFSALTLLRAMDEKFSTNADILRTFYPTQRIKIKGDPKGAAKAMMGKLVVHDLVDEESGEVLIESGTPINKDKAKEIAMSELDSIEVISEVKDPLILNSIFDDQTSSHKEALVKIYNRLRPGNPPSLEKAKQLFHERFFDVTRYCLGRVGRFRLNRKFRLDADENILTLIPDDYLSAIKYVIGLRNPGEERAMVDDIDHLGNRRVRPIDELAGDEFRKGFHKLKRNVLERMNMDHGDGKALSPRQLINSKTVSSSIEYFFARSELSQVVDQTNPLSQLTHERRLSALGPGGLNRKRAGFEVRDVHVSHYGRICPIETPEGTNIGLISSLSIFAQVDEYGFLKTPYLVVKNGKVTDEDTYLRADEENDSIIAPADTPMDKNGKILGDKVLVRKYGDFNFVPVKDIQYIDVSPKQIVGVSASLIPFLEHDDANRALMGSNMQRQAVPLLQTEPPLVATGMEQVVAQNTGMVVKSETAGTVTYVDSQKIVIADKNYHLRKFVGLNERTCLNQKPIVSVGQKVKRGEIIADGAGTSQGELSLGKNILVAFMPWDGYNFEDAIVVSERLLVDDVYTSLHIDSFEIEIRETKLGREEFTRDIPNVSDKALKNLDENGIVRIGTKVRPGDILVGKVAPKSKSELSPEEKLLHAIFGKAGEDVKNDSLEVPSGVEGVVIDAQKFSRKTNLSEEERLAKKKMQKIIDDEYNGKLEEHLVGLITDLEALLGGKVVDHDGTKVTSDFKRTITEMKAVKERLLGGKLKVEDGLSERASKIVSDYRNIINEDDDDKFRKSSRLTQGDDLPTGVLEMVKVFIATKRSLSVGDKFAGRHGNKGVVSKILPIEDMPFLEDGTPVDMILNPLGVPSRMNVGQVLELHLGWAAGKLGFQAILPVFSGTTEADIEVCLREAKLPESGKIQLYDGRTGVPFDQHVAVGQMYMLKLHHLVDDKVHARATGPYSLITQQPLGGKARFGGQRFGEMEVWALEAYGAAHILQELLTIKSDDVDGRTKIYESMVNGRNILEAGTPMSFEVLTNEIKGLALNMVLDRKRLG